MLRTLLKDMLARLRGTGVQRLAADSARLMHEGDACRQSGRNDDARERYARVLALDPDHVDARYALAVLEGMRGDHAAAKTHLDRLLSAAPKHAGAWNALGNVHKLRRDWPAAIDCYRRATTLDPQLASALSNLGVCLRNTGGAPDAIVFLERAAALARADVDIQFNYSLGLIDAGRVDEGEQGLARVLAQRPQMAEAHFALGCRLLAAGRYSDGWREYEWRSLAEDWERRNDEESLPWWQGEPLTGRSLLVRAEQGLGDQIMFASCLPEVLARGGHCVVECDPRLEPIFSRSFPQATVYAQAHGRVAGRKQDGLAPDLQVNIGSLPRLLGRDEGNFPEHSGYLLADSARIATWRARLAGLGAGAKVGISWRGGTWNTRRLGRSLALEDLAPVLGLENARFVSLQYGDCEADLERLERAHGIRLPHWKEAIDDYEETAALVAALDLVVSVQTAVVHLGGALGKPVWVMVSALPEWRYLRGGASIPWYPAVKLFRQLSPGDWAPVIEQLVAEIAQLPTGI